MRYVISSPCFMGAINEVKPPHLLATIAYKGDVQALDKLAYKPKSILFDSGAFTVWNSGKTQTIENVIATYKRLHNKFAGQGIDVNFISLDIIAGKKGIPPTKEQMEQAQQGSWDNYMKLRAVFNDHVLPVFHDVDAPELLDKIISADPKYICVTGHRSNGASIRRFYDRCFTKIPKNIKVHILAGTSAEIMNRYPIFSADSISWKAVALYGRTLTYSNKRKRTAEAVRQIVRRDRDGMVANDLRECMRQQKYYTDLWRARGVSFPEDDE